MSVFIFFLLLTTAIVWAALPLLPALREVLREGDAQPLVVVSRDTGHIDFFARGFRNYIEVQLPKVVAGPAAMAEETLTDGKPVIRITGGMNHALRAGGVLEPLVVAEDDVTIPGDMTFKQELYARSSLAGGADNLYRAVLAEGALSLGPRSTVLRWAHGVGSLEVGEGSALYGRASSDNILRLGRGVSFEQIGAPRIVLGREDTEASETIAGHDRAPFTLPAGARALGDHHRIKGDLIIPPDSRYEGSLVVTGSIHVGVNSEVIGNIKTYGDAVLASEARVDGSIVSCKSIIGGQGCRITGPLIAEGAIKLGHGAVIGTAERPTTLSAPMIQVLTGTVIHGLAVAGESGQVVG